MSKMSRLPSRFPVGTRLVIEGRGGQIHVQYLEFPDGRHIDLPAERPRTGAAERSSRRMRQDAAGQKG